MRRSHPFYSEANQSGYLVASSSRSPVPDRAVTLERYVPRIADWLFTWRQPWADLMLWEDYGAMPLFKLTRTPRRRGS
jgi:hypothetical protein